MWGGIAEVGGRWSSPQKVMDHHARRASTQLPLSLLFKDVFQGPGRSPQEVLALSVVQSSVRVHILIFGR